MRTTLLCSFAAAVLVCACPLAASGAVRASSTATAAVTVTGFSPATATAGTVIEIDGTGFTGASKVKIGGQWASFTVNSDTMIHATVPSIPDTAAATRAKISVFTDHGNFGTSDQEFIIILTPKIKGFSPTSGAVGSTVEIRGTDFNSISGGTIGGQAITSFTVGEVGGATVVDAIVPAGATTGAITLTNPAGTSAPSAKAFKLLPGVTGFSPSSGAKGSTVTISGHNFTGATKVTFGSKAAQTFTVVDDTTITAVVPPKAVSGPIAVVTGAGTGTSAGSFTVTP